MFCINYLSQGEQIVKDLKIIINFKKFQDNKTIDTDELQTSFTNASLISDLIAHNIVKKDQMHIFKTDIILHEEQKFTKEQYIELITSIFNNDQIKYSEENFEILHSISQIFAIEALQFSIERYITYLDLLNQFNIGRLPLIDIEFLCQLYLLDLVDDNFEDTLNATYRFINEIGTETYFQIFYRCIFSRLSKTATYLTFMVNKLNKYIQQFIHILMRNFRLFSFGHNYDDYNLGVVSYLLRYFIENNYMQRSDDETFNYQVGWRTYTYQFFDFDDGSIHYDSTYYVYRHYDELTRNNYELHRKLVLNGKNQNPLFQIIEKDDLNSLQKLIAFDPSIDVDTTIESCYYESRPLFQLNSFSLIEIAAFFGSINIFKFLIVNNAILRKDKLRMMALYGGNTEIIRICQQNNISYGVTFLKGNLMMNCDVDKSIMIAIKMNYFDILRWLVEEEQIDLNNNSIDLIGYSIRCCNFVAFYYLIKVIYGDQFNSINFERYLNDIVISCNIPIIKNYLSLKNENLLEMPKEKVNYTDKFFFENLVICNDISFIEMFLKDNKIIELKDVPYENISSLTYQRICRYFLTHKNVSCSTEFKIKMIEDLIQKDREQNEKINEEYKNRYPIYNMKKNYEFIKEQIDLLYEKSSNLEEKFFLLPAIFKYNLYENNYINKYENIMNSETSVRFEKIINFRNIFIGFITYTNCEVLKFLLQRMDEESKKKFKSSSYIIGNALKMNRIDIFSFLITSEISPFSEKYKFDKESFFDIFYEIKSIEMLKKAIQIYNDKMNDCNFYKDIFLPNVLFNAADSNEVIIEYLLNLPEIEPYINKVDENHDNLPPLLYLARYTNFIDTCKPFLNNEKVDINIRSIKNNRNLIAFESQYDSLMIILKNDRFKYTNEDVTYCIENQRYPGTLDVFELFLNGLLYENDENHKNPLNLKIDFTDEQLSRIFNKLCITDDRVELAKRFYSKFSDKIDVNYASKKNCSFCLLDAIDCDCCKMVEFLLNISELDLNIRASTGSVNSHMNDNDNVTPFNFAVACGKDEIIHLFFKRKSDFDINEGPTTCLHLAASRDDALLIKKLLNFPNIDKYKIDQILKIFIIFIMISN